MNAGLVLQAAVAGAAAGAVYGLVGLGYTLVYRMSGVLNFAHGDVVTAGIYTFLLVVGGGGAVALVGLPPGLLAAGLAVALVAGALVAVAIEKVAVAPFRARRSEAEWAVAIVAGGLLLRALVGIRFQAESYTIPEILPVRSWLGTSSLDLPGGGVVQVRSMVVLAVGIVLAVGFDSWLKRSRTGKAMEATTQDEVAAGLCGLSTRRLRLLAWALAGVLAVIAGLLVAPSRPLTIELGVVLGLKGTCAAVLGRLGRARATVVAGLAIGVGESLVTSLSLPGLELGPIRLARFGPFTGLQDAGALLVLVVALALAPGLLGRAEVVD